MVSSGPLTTAEGSVSAVATFFGWDDSGSTGVATGFESPFTIGAINGQQSWYANSTANVISSVNPANGSQHYRLTSTTSGGAFALSPNFAAGTTRYISASANIRISDAGAYLEFTPQDPANAAVTTRIRFSGAASRDIQTVDWSASSYVPTGETAIDTYSRSSAVDRATDNVRICKWHADLRNHERQWNHGQQCRELCPVADLWHGPGGSPDLRCRHLDELHPSYECDFPLPPSPTP